MKITPSPVRMDCAPLEAAVWGDVLTLNGAAYDFSMLAEGDLYDAADLGSDWITGPIERRGGQICLTLILPCGPRAPEEARFPATIEVAGGIVPLPPYGAEPEETPIEDAEA